MEQKIRRVKKFQGQRHSIFNSRSYFYAFFRVSGDQSLKQLFKLETRPCENTVGSRGSFMYFLSQEAKKELIYQQSLSQIKL